MDAETRQLQQLIAQKHQVPEILLLKSSTGSTNDDVKTLTSQGIKTALICSETQTQGRGQHQRQWQSPKGNIYFSTILNTQNPIDGRLGLEIALNLLHMPCLSHFKQLYVKWANDLYSAQGKWGGILIEPLSNHQVIVGVGINVLPKSELKSLDQAATSLTQLGLLDVSRIELIAQIYTAIQQAGQWFDHGSQNLAQRFNHVAMYKDEIVTFETDNQTFSGTFLGITNNGAVKIDTKEGSKSFYQGRLRHA